MKIKKVINFDNCYDFMFEKDNKSLSIFYGGNLDLYLSLRNGTSLLEEDTNISFDITKENYQLFNAFDELYNNIINGLPFGKDEKTFDYRKRSEFFKLVDKDKNITWISDEGPEEKEDKITIKKIDEDTYRLDFYRNKESLDDGMKNPFAISVRIRNSGSRYNPFNCAFMLMYQQIQKIDPEYHQMHFEEIEYIKKLEKKKY